MVDSLKSKSMADRIDDLTERVQTVEGKVDHLSISLDRRFDAIDATFVGQREYTEFAYARLDAKMDTGFGRVDERFDRMDERFDRMDERFDRMDERFDRMDERFDRMDGRFDRMDGRFDRMDGRFERMDERFDRLERKLDQFIDRLWPHG